jgi:hypothetical protein
MSVATQTPLRAGSRVIVRIAGDDHEMPCRIEDVATDRVVITAPFPRPPMAVGDRLALEWGTHRGWYSVVASYEGNDERTWTVRARTGATLLQRREYARAHVPLPVAMLFGAADDYGDARSGSLVDISEGGARCVLSHPCNVHIGDPATTVLATDRIQLSVSGVVVRCVARDQWLDEVSVRFDQPVPDASGVRQEVLQWQLREGLGQAS